MCYKNILGYYLALQIACILPMIQNESSPLDEIVASLEEDISNCIPCMKTI